MRVFGIDQSLSCTAITQHVVELDWSITKTQHWFTTDVKKRSVKMCDNIMPLFIGKFKGFQKIKRIASLMDQLFEVEAKDGDILALEGYSFASTSSAIFQLGELGGVIKWLAHKYNMRVRTYEPTVIKKYATDKGAGKKAPMLMAYYQQYPDSNVLKHYAELNLKLPLEPQLSKSAGKPLCDLIDSHFIADMLLDEQKLRTDILHPEVSDKKASVFTSMSKKGKPTFLETPYE
jgi:hypothetical protein